jgi:hypothetical protein
LSRAYSFAILILFIVWSVDALLLQAEMALWHSTPLPNMAVKAIVILLMMVAGLTQIVSGRAQRVPQRILSLWFAFIFLLLIETPVFVLGLGYPTDYVLFSYNAYYFGILLLPLFFYFRETLSESLIIRTLLVFFVPSTLLGIAQHFSGNPLLPTDSPNEYLQVMSWNFFGSIRAFSLFAAPSYFGHFLALIGGLGLALCLARNRSAKKGFAITVLVLLGGYSTFTRATQLEIALVMLTVWMLYRHGHQRLLSVLPLIYGVFGLFVAFVAPLLVGSFSSDDLFSTWSIAWRYESWALYGAYWLGKNLTTFLFGAGIAQNGRFSTSEGVIVDNSFIGVGVHIGVVGLVLWFMINWAVWKYMLGELKRSLSPVRAAAAGACSVWLFTSVFNITLFYPLPFLLFLLTNLRYRKGENLSRSPLAPLGERAGGEGVIRDPPCQSLRGTGR